MKKIIEMIKKNSSYLLFIFLLLGLNSFLLADLNQSRFHGIEKITFLLSILFNVVMIVGFSIFLKKKETMKMEKLYLIMILPFSICYLLLFPFNRVPDESSHFLRAYEMTRGHLVSSVSDKGRTFDENIDKTILGNDNYHIFLGKRKIKESDKKIVYRFYNTSVYAFPCYIPQAFGIGLARMLGLSYFFQFYMGRLFNLLVFTVMMYFAIKWFPFKKTLIFLLSFIPIVLQASCSLSADALTIASATLFVSLLFRLKEEKEKRMTKKQMIGLALLALLLSLCKIVYLPICFLLLLLPKEKFGSKKERNIYIITLLVSILVINLLWLKHASVYLPSTADGRNSAKQIHYILGHIPRFAMSIFLTYQINIVDFMFQFFGFRLGLFDIGVSYFYTMPLLILFIFIALLDNEQKIIVKKIERAFITLVILGVIFLISTSLYVQWTGVGNNLIEGIQGRYFLPLASLFAFLSTTKKITPKIKWNNRYLYLFLIALHSYTIFCVFYKFI